MSSIFKEYLKLLNRLYKYNLFNNFKYSLKFNDSSILITIISCDYLNLSLANEHVGDVTIPGGLANQIEIFKLNYIYI